MKREYDSWMCGAALWRKRMRDMAEPLVEKNTSNA